MASVVGRVAWWVVGAVLVVAGAVMVAVTQPETVTEVTYLSSSEGADWAMSSGLELEFAGGTFVSVWQIAGVGVAVLGLLVLVGRAAYLLGRRTTTA